MAPSLALADSPRPLPRLPRRLIRIPAEARCDVCGDTYPNGLLTLGAGEIVCQYCEADADAEQSLRRNLWGRVARGIGVAGLSALGVAWLTAWSASRGTGWLTDPSVGVTLGGVGLLVGGLGFVVGGILEILRSRRLPEGPVPVEPRLVTLVGIGGALTALTGVGAALFAFVWLVVAAVV